MVLYKNIAQRHCPPRRCAPPTRTLASNTRGELERTSSTAQRTSAARATRRWCAHVGGRAAEKKTPFEA
jgi:hypothetical protein